MRAASSSTISVVIAAFDAEAFLGEALGSVLGQTLRPDEVIVVDDGSTDRTSEVACGFGGVRCLTQPANLGQATALNVGVAASVGGLLAFLDADDLWQPSKLEHQAALFAARPELDVVYGLARQRWIGGRPPPRASEAVAVPAYLPSAMLVRRAAFQRVGPFDPRWRLGSVVDWYARSVEAGLLSALLPEVVYERRIHGQNLGITAVKDRSDYLGVVKAALDRRRGGPS
jgi:glycosyltransferase involved in cell wall biosynthesis